MHREKSRQHRLPRSFRRLDGLLHPLLGLLILVLVVKALRLVPEDWSAPLRLVQKGRIAARLSAVGDVAAPGRPILAVEGRRGQPCAQALLDDLVRFLARLRMSMALRYRGEQGEVTLFLDL